MSLYTNDTDTLRQMIAQSMAQLISSVFTIVAVLVCMLYVSFYLTLVAVLVMLLILQIVRVVTEKIGGFFLMQQKTLADVNGYVEEMVNGQKVIKVFCHEETAKKELAEKNRTWATGTRTPSVLLLFRRLELLPLFLRRMRSRSSCAREESGFEAADTRG